LNYFLGLNSEPIKEIPDPVLSGVGLIRGEYLCRYLEEYVTENSCQIYISSYLSEIAGTFDPFEVWYRTTEFSSEEINVLKGADHKVMEPQSLFGERGVRRSLKYKEVFEIELGIVSQLSKTYGNLNIIFPFVTDARDLEECLSLLSKSGFNNKYGVMLEIPSALNFIEDFISLGVSNITIGLNDLTTFMLGVRRGAPGYDMNHKAIYAFISKAANTINKRVPLSVAGYLNEEVVGNCESLGVDNVIIHYSDLNRVLHIPAEKLEYSDRLKDIKRLTKKRILDSKDGKI